MDPVQAEIVDIFKETADICVVGDDDQAIYQFRGADERNIQAFSQSAGCTTLALSENRRCPTNILAITESNISLWGTDQDVGKSYSQRYIFRGKVITDKNVTLSLSPQICAIVMSHL